MRRGELEALPIQDGALDAATLLLVLHHLPDPAEALAEAARVLRPGGRLLISDMLPHDRETYRQQMGHVWLGFGEDALQKHAGSAGFDQIRIASMPAIRMPRGRRYSSLARRACSPESLNSTVATEGGESSKPLEQRSSEYEVRSFEARSLQAASYKETK